MATHTVSKQKNGVFTLGPIGTGEDEVPAEDFQCQQRNVRIITPEQGDDAIEEVLDGTPLEDEEGERPYKLGITAVQDFTNPAGFQKYCWDNDGKLVPFTWMPRGVSGPTFTGTVKVSAIGVGGEMNRRLDAEAEWSCSAKPTWTPAAG